MVYMACHTAWWKIDGGHDHMYVYTVMSYTHTHTLLHIGHNTSMFVCLFVVFKGEKIYKCHQKQNKIIKY